MNFHVLTLGVLVASFVFFTGVLYLPSVKLENREDIPPFCSASPYSKGAFALIEIFNDLPGSWGFTRYGVRSIDVVTYERDTAHSRAIGRYQGDEEVEGSPQINIEAIVFCSEALADNYYQYARGQIQVRVGHNPVCNSLIAKAGEESFSCTDYQAHHGIVFRQDNVFAYVIVSGNDLTMEHAQETANILVVKVVQN